MSEIPTAHQIQAAQQCARLLGTEASPRPNRLRTYAQAATDGLFGLEELLAAESLLTAAGLVEATDDEVIIPAASLSEFGLMEVSEATSALVAMLLNRCPPTWLVAASGASVLTEFVPDRAGRRLAELMPDPERRESLLMAAAGKVDPTDRAALGLRGEEAVLRAYRDAFVNAGRPDLLRDLAHVSTVTDQLGYDLSVPTLDRGRIRIEVKTARFSINARAFLSRNEARVGAADPGWVLMLCRVAGDESIRVEGWCSFVALRNQLPQDSPPGRWASVEVTMTEDLLTPGLLLVQPRSDPRTAAA